jgi:dipeptidyl aminopeptidase/acylaminoacyl peptidase
MTSYADYRPDRRFQPTVAISPDGSQVAYADNASGQYNLVVQPVDGGTARRLTGYTDSTVREVIWAPDGASLFFLADTHGDEFYQVRRIARDGGPVEALTEAPKVQYALGHVSPDGRRLAYAGNDREPSTQDVLVHDLVTGEVRRAYDAGGMVFPFHWSPDGSRLATVELRGNTDHVLYVVPLAGPPTRVLPVGDGKAQFLPVAWLGGDILLRTDAGRDFVGLARVNPDADPERGERGGLHWLATPDWDVEHAELSADGRILVWTVNVDGANELCARDLTTGTDLDVPRLPAGTVDAISLSADGSRLAVLLSTGTLPANVAVVHLDTGRLQWLTDARPVAATAVAEPDLVRFPTHDGRDIPAWLYRPAGPGPFGVVLSIHGGPEAQERPRYNYAGLYQYLLHEGIGVLAPNVRGSTGYGTAYQRLILRDFGGAELGDFEAAARYLRGLDWVDPDRIGVFGGSYGGFATLSCLSRLPQYWACGVSIVGPSNLVTFARSVPPTWRPIMAAWVGDPETEADFLLSRSPVTYADAIRAPLFVIQGANDPRVVQAESDQIVAKLRARGVEVRYDVYPDEGHGFTKRENEAKALGDTAEFLASHLAGVSG